ncbi:MAG: InlB B-repeat-containing protein, partial [Clostridia bacterium]|nr:InlB B-repeat-containing protein [Clostridia bacterium]
LGAEITAPANPTREGYVFFGWDKTVGNLETEGATFNAVWEMNHVAAYREAGYTVVYIKTGVDKNGSSPITPCKNFATALSKTKSLTADDTVVYAILDNVNVTGWQANGPASMIITKGNEAGQIYIDNVFFNNNRYSATDPVAKKITFDNIKIGLNPGNSGDECAFYALSSDIEFTSTVVVNPQYKFSERTAGVMVHPFGAGSANNFTDKENVNVTINSGLIHDIRATGFQGGSSTGDITYVFGGTATIASVNVAGHAQQSGIANKTVTGDIFVTVKENATVNNFYPSNIGNLNGDLYVNVEGGTVTNLYLNSRAGGTSTGDYIITYTGGTIGSIKASNTAYVFGTKRILIADLDKVTLPAVCTNLTGILTYTANGSITLNEDLTKIIITPEANAKYVKVTMGESVKTYNVNGDEVTLAGEFEVEYTGGNVSVEFLTDGTETKKVTFKNGDETVSEALVAVGTVPTAPTLTKTGYTFSWDKEIVAVTEAVTYNAVWTAKEYDVVFNAGEGTFADGKTVTVKATFDSAITTPTEEPTRTGYTFKGWDPVVGTLTAEGATFNAVWEANTYTITYYVDGTEYKTVTYAYGAEVTMESAPEKDGYTFSGWDKTIATMPDEDVTITGTFTENAPVFPTTPTYNTYGVYDPANGTYTVELKLAGVKANAGSFGFVLPGLKSVTAAEGVSLFAELGDGVSPIYAKGEDYYANTWAIEKTPGYIDATEEEVLIATFVLDATASFPEMFNEYVVDNADEKYHYGGNYLVTPHIDNNLGTEKAPVIYAAHSDSVEEPDFDGVKFTTKGTYDPTKNQYSIEIYVEGTKINLGAFGLAFNSAYMTFDPEDEESVKLADGIANYLDIVLNNTAEGYAFAFDGSSNEEGYIDATNGAVLVATITVGMTADQRTAFVNVGKTMDIFVPDASVDGIEKYFDFEENAYIASLYTNDLDIPKVATVYASHTDEALEPSTADLKVKVDFTARDGEGFDNAVIVLNESVYNLVGTEHTFSGLEIGKEYTVEVKKNGYLAASYTITLDASAELTFSLLAGDIKGSAGDICGDGVVDLSDFVRLIRAFDGNAGDDFKASVDLNEDGNVNVADLSIIKRNYGRTSGDTEITKN